jgi:hypothetical protein
MTPSELPAAFHDYVVKSVDAKGWPLAPGWILNAAGELTVMAMDLTPPQIYVAILAEAAKQKAAAFAFAIDRFAKPGQGTTRPDLLAGHLSTAGASGVRPFIIEYDPATGVVDPMNFGNPFWNRALTKELVGMLVP